MMVTSRALGDGSTAVCDDGTVGVPGGVPGVDPPVFGGSQVAADAINDLGCRYGARSFDSDACTRDFSAISGFVDPTTTVQFCPNIGIGSELAFASGDTLLTVRVRNIVGQLGPAARIVIRVP